MMSLPEITAPSGTLESGLYALKAGADALYFGLPRFSARAAAENLTVSDVRRLKGAAEAGGKKIYAALNTIIAEDEIADALRAIADMALVGADAIIVQDLGLAALIRREFPDLPIHASTQLAVHTADGLQTAKRLGFRRAVLSRELRFKEIEALQPVAPSVEREIFIHGALCYGFSGLCLASSHLTGRSGNRGACAQICRSWFESEIGRRYFFSASDLDGGKWVSRLAEIGVSALKIEGRLKSSAYAFHTVAYYRALLDGNKDKAAFHRERSALSFTRPKTSGFLRKKQKTPLIQKSYPSHVGIPGATVTAVRGGKITVRALTPLSAHDRLFRVPSSPPDEGDTFVLSRFQSNRASSTQLQKGKTAELVLETPARVRVGETLMKTLAHDLHFKSLAKGAYPEWKRPLRLEVAEAPVGLRFRTEICGRTVNATYEMPVEPARGDRDITEVLGALFAESKAFGFTFDSVQPEIDGAPIARNRFVPPSALKQARNAFYDAVEQARVRPISSPTDTVALLREFDLSLPNRSEIGYADDFMFVAEGAPFSLKDAPIIDGRRYLSLPPVMFRAEETVSSLTAAVAEATDLPLLVGLNNIGHLKIAERWRRFAHVSFYIDYGLYAANVETLLFFKRTIERLRGAYLWLEADDAQRDALLATIESAAGSTPPGIRIIEEKERFPLFISRVCFHRALENRCPSNCPKVYTYALRQQSRSLNVRVTDCVTYVHLERP